MFPSHIIQPSFLHPEVPLLPDLQNTGVRVYFFIELRVIYQSGKQANCGKDELQGGTLNVEVSVGGARVIMIQQPRGLWREAKRVFIYGGDLNGAVQQFRRMIEEVPSGSMPFATAQKSLLELDQLCSDRTLTAYSDLLMWTMENAQQLALSMTTKYHARVYFDSVLSHSSGISQNRMMPLFIACLSLAIKFHEKRDVSERLTMSALMAGAGIDLASDEYFQFEVSILQILGFRMRYTTPQDYLDSFIRSFPHKHKLFQQALPPLILLALIHPEACKYTAEEIFFGAVLAVLEMIPLNLNDSQKRKIFRLSSRWEQAAKVKALIEEQTQMAEAEEEELSEE